MKFLRRHPECYWSARPVASANRPIWVAYIRRTPGGVRPRHPRRTRGLSIRSLSLDPLIFLPHKGGQAVGPPHRYIAPASMVLAGRLTHVPGGAYSRRPLAYLSARLLRRLSARSSLWLPLVSTAPCRRLSASQLFVVGA